MKHLAILMSLFLFLCCGCSGDDPDFYQIEGFVSFDGQPLPYGLIQFIPDQKKGNPGPATLTTIEAGKFNTAEGRGVIGGAYQIKITGFSSKPAATTDETAETETLQPTTDTTLFRGYIVELELPQEDTSQTFEVPAGAKGSSSARSGDPL